MCVMRLLSMRMVLWAMWVVCLAGCATDMGSPAAATQPQTNMDPNRVVIDNFTFGPQKLMVAVGTKVTWVNRDDVPHTVTSSDEPKVLNSPVLDTDGQFTYTFSEPGTYAYYCTVHPHMTGLVVVK